MTYRDPVTNRIISAETHALITAQSALLAAENEHVVLEQRLTEAVQSGEVEDAAKLAAEFGPLRQRITALKAAVEAATSEEDKRLQAARAAEGQARLRALRAHAANFAKHARAITIAERDAEIAYRNADEALSSARAILGDAAVFPGFSAIDWPNAQPPGEDKKRNMLIAALHNSLTDAAADMQAALPATENAEEAA